MTLLELWNKYSKSGINGEPMITTKELKELSTKLGEMIEFFDNARVINMGLFSFKTRVDSMIQYRKVTKGYYV